MLSTPFEFRESLESLFAGSKLQYIKFARRILILDGFVSADRLVVSVIVVVPSAQPEPPRIFASIPAEEIVAISAGRESAMFAAKDEYPGRILTDLTAPWILFRFTSLVVEVVVITVDLQSLLELCQLLLARA